MDDLFNSKKNEAPEQQETPATELPLADLGDVRFSRDQSTKPETGPGEEYGPELRSDPLFQIHELVQERSISDKLNIPSPAPGVLVQGACGMASDLAYHALSKVYNIPDENLVLHQVGDVTSQYEDNPARPNHAVLLIKDAHEFFGGEPRDILFDATAAQFDGSPGVMGTTPDGNMNKYLADHAGDLGTSISNDLRYKGFVELEHGPVGDHKAALLFSSYRADEMNPEPSILPIEREALYSQTRELQLSLQQAYPRQSPAEELVAERRHIQLYGEDIDPSLSRTLTPEEAASELEELEMYTTFGLEDLPPTMRERYDELTKS